MIGRAWFVLSLLWFSGLFLLAYTGAAAAGESVFSYAPALFWVIAAGPFFVPVTFRFVARFIIGRP